MDKAIEPCSLGGLEFDALIDETLDLQADIPDYPTEAGFSIHDAIITSPVRLDVTVYLTDTPVTWRQRFGKRRAADMALRLEQLFFERKPVTFYTSHRVYENMGIESIYIPRTPETGGGAFEVSMTLKQIRTTTAKAVALASPRGGETKSSAGTAATEEESAKGSILINAFNAITGYIAGE
jgi:hypothetical protein